jgi:hypothetical protein
VILVLLQIFNFQPKFDCKNSNKLQKFKMMREISAKFPQKPQDFKINMTANFPINALGVFYCYCYILLLQVKTKGIISFIPQTSARGQRTVHTAGPEPPQGHHGLCTTTRGPGPCPLAGQEGCNAVLK